MVFAVSSFFWGLFFERNEKQTKLQSDTTQPEKINKTTRCKHKNHIVLFTKKESRQHRHKTMHFIV